MTRPQIWRKMLHFSLVLALVGVTGNIFLIGMPRMNKIAYSIEAPVTERATPPGMYGEMDPMAEDRPSEAAAAPGFWDGVDGRYLLDKVFTVGWGAGQLLIGAWAAVAFKKRKRDE